MGTKPAGRLRPSKTSRLLPDAREHAQGHLIREFAMHHDFEARALAIFGLGLGKKQLALRGEVGEGDCLPTQRQFDDPRFLRHGDGLGQGVPAKAALDLVHARREAERWLGILHGHGLRTPVHFDVEGPALVVAGERHRHGGIHLPGLLEGAALFVQVELQALGPGATAFGLFAEERRARSGLVVVQHPRHPGLERLWNVAGHRRRGQGRTHAEHGKRQHQQREPASNVPKPILSMHEGLLAKRTKRDGAYALLGCRAAHSAPGAIAGPWRRSGSHPAALDVSLGASCNRCGF
jgi:hypothetical protein